MPPKRKVREERQKDLQKPKRQQKQSSSSESEVEKEKQAKGKPKTMKDAVLKILADSDEFLTLQAIRKQVREIFYRSEKERGEIRHHPQRKLDVRRR